MERGREGWRGGTEGREGTEGEGKGRERREQGRQTEGEK